MNIHFSAQSDEWATPQELFDKLNAEFNFTLDPCATHENTKCDRYFSKVEDGLAQPWTDERVFCNPPYNRYVIKAWLKKMAECDAEVVVALLPARTNTSWFHDFVWMKPGVEIRFIRGKLKFNDYKWQAPFPSMVVIFGKVQ